MSDAQLDAALTGALFPYGTLQLLAQEAENDALNAGAVGENVCPSMAFDGSTLTMTGDCTGNAGLLWTGSVVAENLPTNGWWRGEVATEVSVLGGFVLTVDDFSLADGDEVMSYTGVVSGPWPDANVESRYAFDLGVAGESISAFHASGGWNADEATVPTVVSVDGLPELTLQETSIHALFTEGLTLLGDGVEIEVDLSREQGRSDCYSAVVNGEGGREACPQGWNDAKQGGTPIDREETELDPITVVDGDWVDGELALVAGTSGTEWSLEAHLVGDDRTSVEVHSLYMPGVPCGCVAYGGRLRASGSYEAGESTALAEGSDAHLRFVAYDYDGGVLGCRYEGLDESEAGDWFDDIGCPD